MAGGVDHIDTSDFYGPHVSNQLIREALAPYPADLVIVTKVGARRGDDASWIPAFEPEDLVAAVHDNLRNLGAEAMEPARAVEAPAPEAPAPETLKPKALPKLGAELGATSVSGLSSGAYMAGQLQVAHSKDIIGAGIVAGGPYACAESPASLIFPFWPTAVAQNASQAAFNCMKTYWGKPDGEALARRAAELAQAGKIDPLEGLKSDNVYLFSGAAQARAYRAGRSPERLR